MTFLRDANEKLYIAAGVLDAPLVPEELAEQPWCPWCGVDTKGGFCSSRCLLAYAEDMHAERASDR